MQTELR
jgi:hypothetical protein